MMGLFQAYNGKTKSWVKYKVTQKGSTIKDVKQKNPQTPFRNIMKRGNRK